MEELEMIRHRIFEMRGQKVILDRDLATLYGVETRAINQAVKRNAKRFPGDFMFQLTKEEWEGLRSQFVILEEGSNGELDLRLQNETIKTGDGRGRHTKYLPYAFTEQGVAMLSGVVNSDRAIEMNIAIMRAFVEIRRIVFRKTDLLEQIGLIRQRLEEHDVQLKYIYDTLENLLDEKVDKDSKIPPPWMEFTA